VQSKCNASAMRRGFLEPRRCLHSSFAPVGWAEHESEGFVRSDESHSFVVRLRTNIGIADEIAHKNRQDCRDEQDRNSELADDKKAAEVVPWREVTVTNSQEGCSAEIERLNCIQRGHRMIAVLNRCEGEIDHCESNNEFGNIHERQNERTRQRHPEPRDSRIEPLDDQLVQRVDRDVEDAVERKQSHQVQQVADVAGDDWNGEPENNNSDEPANYPALDGLGSIEPARHSLDELKRLGYSLFERHRVALQRYTTRQAADRNFGPRRLGVTWFNVMDMQIGRNS
jgi:hypothetical protein